MEKTGVEVVQGGPGSDVSDAGAAGGAGAAAGAPETVTITLAGQQYTVPKALGEGIIAERDKLGTEYGSRVRQYDARHQADTGRIAELEKDGEPVVEALVPPNPQDLIDNPEKYHAANMAWQNRLVTAAVAQVDEKVTNAANAADAREREQAMSADWNKAVGKFFTEYPHLKDDQDIVDTIWRANFKELGDMTPETGFKRLAQLSSDRIAKITERGKSNAAPRLESSGGAAPRVRKAAEEEPNVPERGGLSQLVKERQRRFRNPNLKEVAA